MNEPIRIVIADDYPMFREGLKLILQHYPQLKVTGEAGNGRELVDLVENQRPDVVIADIQMPEMDGVQATKIISAGEPSPAVIGLTMYGEYHQIIAMLGAGAKGYLLKNVMKDDLVQAIEAVLNGEEYFCNSTSLMLAKMISRSKAPEKKLYPPEAFTEKEKEVIRLLCEELASKEIADETKLSKMTVDTYRKRILEKIGCRNVAGVVVYAVRTGMFRV